jgi:flagellar biosynthesis protein FlhA
MADLPAEVTTNGNADAGGAGLGFNLPFLPDVDTLNRFTAMLRRGDIAFALGLVLILVVLMLPMPTWLLDISIAISLTYSFLVLMVAIFIEKPLEFSSFPTVLLIATLLRLSLNPR